MSTAVKLGVVVIVAAALIAIVVHKRERPGTETPATLSTSPATESAAVSLPRLVDLGSDQCIPCKRMAPILEELAADCVGILSVEVLDVRKDPSLAEAYGIRLIPTQIFYDAEGGERFRHEGFMSREAIAAAWSQLGVSVPPPRDAGPEDDRSGGAAVAPGAGD